MAFIDDLGKGAIGFAGSLGAGLINNALSQHNAKQQQAWQEKMWHMQNEYNDPSAMANRMRAAGLNPFAMTGAQPAGSAGNGAMAQTIPVESPLTALSTIAQIENLNASTNRIETDSERLLKEISILDQKYQYGLLEYEDYKRELNLKFDEWDNRNPFTVQRENTESQTAKNNADAKLSEELKNESIVRQSNMGFENQLLQKRLAWFDKDHQAAIDQIRSSIELMDAQTQNYVAQTDNLELLTNRIEFVNACSDFVGFDISHLPPASLTQVLGYYRDALLKYKSPQDALRSIFNVIVSAGRGERAIMSTSSESSSLSGLWGLGTSSSSSQTYNSNR